MRTEGWGGGRECQETKRLGRIKIKKDGKGISIARMAGMYLEGQLGEGIYPVTGRD